MSLKTTEIEEESAPHAQDSDELGAAHEAATELVTGHAGASPVGHSAAKNFGALLRHELNNPLTGILGNAELLLLELRRHNVDVPGSIQQRLEIIASLAVRMREVVRVLSDRWEGESAQSRPRVELTDSGRFH